MKKQNTKINEIRKITWIGLFTNIALSLLKFIVGFFGNSQAVIADAIHSLSDMATDFAVIIGVKYWEPPADEDHPYGHKRIETLITLIIGLILAYVGYEIIYKAIVTIPKPDPKKTTWIAALGPLLSVIVKELLFRWTLHTGKKEKSSAVIANAWHHRSDAISSFPALISVGIAAIFPKFSFVDHIGAIVVSGFIFKVSWDIIKPAFLELTDQGATKKEMDKINSIALNTKGVISTHKIRSRKSGSGYFVDIHIQVDGNLSVKDGHEISEEVKENIISKGPDVIDVVVHLEPFEKHF